jgi:hypothetical protein
MEKKEAGIILCIVACIDIIIFSLFWLYFDWPEYQPETAKVVTENIVREPEESDIENKDLDDVEEDKEFSVIETEIVAFTLSEDEYLGALDNDGTSRIRGALEGYSFYVNNVMVFNFKTGGLYSGFFDSKNTSVSGYGYEVTVYYDKYLLNIYNPDRTQAVSYVISIDSSNNLYIYYEGADALMKLKKI